MRRVTSRTTFSFQRRMFERKGTLLVRVTLNTCCIGAGSQSRLLEFKAAVGIVTITTLHHSLENFMMKRLVEISFRFSVTTDAELWLPSLQHVDSREARLFSIRRGHPGD